ncbi:GNAT family N-acetyltransferase [Paenibacillus sp. MMS18-CY102]|uniref:GNAT family N-acetyltransferase n=1 Tax=Paenibacillus sp. MMS18-CY102 TaxID=2682849 RepID=UPI001365577B|nr:GNAT family N-acetyltransferase [Paenibacillus sp. MMS18-CY102]MWC27974.1 GNAT family N-acetyltransferase [Paenibacillus sp. MMS18-CY102]
MANRAIACLTIVRQMNSGDILTIHEALGQIGRQLSVEDVACCWRENLSGDRITLLAYQGDQLAGWSHLLATSAYPSFAVQGIPEIQDLIVWPTMRRQGIAKALMAEIESIAFRKFGIVGLGVGLYADYGIAQRLYAKRGYLPDGHGIMHRNVSVKPGFELQVDDDLLLYLTKEML